MHYFGRWDTTSHGLLRPDRTKELISLHITTLLAQVPPASKCRSNAAQTRSVLTASAHSWPCSANRMSEFSFRPAALRAMRNRRLERKRLANLLCSTYKNSSHFGSSAIARKFLSTENSLAITPGSSRDGRT